MKQIGFTLGLLLMAATVQAQVAPTDHYEVRFYNQGSPTAIQVSPPIGPSSFTCNMVAPSVPPVVTNPTKLFFDDVANAGKVCLYTDPGTSGGILFSVPLSGNVLEATINVFTTTGAASGESARSNTFTHPGQAPPVRTGFKAIQ